MNALIWWIGAAHVALYSAVGLVFVAAGLWNRVNSRLYGSAVILQWHFERLRRRRSEDRIVG